MGATRFTIVCPVFNTSRRMLRACVESVIAQSYPHWELALVDDASSDPKTIAELDRLSQSDERIRMVRLDANLGVAGANNAGAHDPGGEHLVFLDHDDLLAPAALAWLSTCAADADLIYSDSDHIDDDGVHRAPFFKPGWSPRLLLSVNYVNHLMCIRAEVFHEIGGFRRGIDGVNDHDLLLRLAERPMTVAHIPNILYHWRRWGDSVSQDPAKRVQVEKRGLGIIAEAIERRGWNAHAALGNGVPFSYRVVFDPEPEPPLVKVIMPTRDGGDMLRTAVDGVLTRTDGVGVHLVVVDNGSRAPDTLEFLADIARRDDVTVHEVDDAFNMSRLLNEGVAAGPDAPLVLFINNDIEIKHRRWLLQLSGWMRDPEVKAAGPLLLYPDGRVQHAGVILGFGRRRTAENYARGESNRPRSSSLHDQAREVSCLSAACLLMRTADYLAVGGMSEDLPLDFHEVDLLLRVSRELGGSLVYDPTFPLVHLESASRGGASGGGMSGSYAIPRLRFLWGPELDKPDFFYNPHLSLTRNRVVAGDIPGDVDQRRQRIRPRFSPPPR